MTLISHGLRFQMRHKLFSPRGHTYSLHLFSFLQCGFSNVSSNRLSERMHSCIGCTCSVFLRCVFSNVSSNGLHEKIYIHTDCICSTFLHCVFLNVSSRRHHKMIQSHIGCIYLTFSTVRMQSFLFFLNLQKKRMHSDIGCIC